jgi:hypothetical protein
MIPDPYEYIHHSQCGQNSIFDVGNKEKKENKEKKRKKIKKRKKGDHNFPHLRIMISIFLQPLCNYRYLKYRHNRIL